ncbi:MAG: hypothetical protein ACK5ES_12410, partial [Planctomyces sp.]
AGRTLSVVASGWTSEDVTACSAAVAAGETRGVVLNHEWTRIYAARAVAAGETHGVVLNHE